MHTSRSISSDLLTSSSSDCLLFLVLLHYSEAFHNVNTPLPFQNVGASYSWLCSFFASTCPLSCQPLLMFPDSNRLHPSPSSLLLLTNESHWDTGGVDKRTWESPGRFLDYSCLLPSSWSFWYMPTPCWGVEAERVMLPKIN